MFSILVYRNTVHTSLPSNKAKPQLHDDWSSYRNAVVECIKAHSPNSAQFHSYKDEVYYAETLKRGLAIAHELLRLHNDAAIESSQAQYKKGTKIRSCVKGI
jgi:hypothetical protein